MSRKSGGARLQCAEAKAAAADLGCCFLALPPAAPSGVDGDGGFNLSWTLHRSFHPPAGLFASVGQQVGVGFPGASSGATSPETPRDPYMKYVSPEVGHRVVEPPLPGEGVELREKGKKKKKAVKLKIKVGNHHLKRLISGAIAGAVSRTAVAPLETIRTHLMVGSNGNSSTEVFQSIMKHEGWTGLFRGNFVNVIRVAPSKAIETAILGDILGSGRATPKLLLIYVPFTLLAVIAILRGLCSSCSQRTTADPSPDSYMSVPAADSASF